LVTEVLGVGRDSGVSVNHPTNMHQIYASEKPL
jgi:hypothetical protein